MDNITNNIIGAELNIHIIDKCFREYLKESMKQYGLNSTQALVILMLYTKEHGEEEKFFLNHRIVCDTQEQLIGELHYDKGAMTRTMKSLEEKGAVSRSVNPNDSRSVVFSLTDKGIIMKKEIITALKKWSESVFGEQQNSELLNSSLSLLAEKAKELI